jgi:hypothetical protein
MALKAVEARRTSSGPLTGAVTLVSPEPSARAALARSDNGRPIWREISAAPMPTMMIETSAPTMALMGAGRGPGRRAVALSQLDSSRRTEMVASVTRTMGASAGGGSPRVGIGPPSGPPANSGGGPSRGHAPPARASDVTARL